MGTALGILGITTFISMFTVGWCLNSKSNLKEKIKELEKVKNEK